MKLRASLIAITVLLLLLLAGTPTSAGTSPLVSSAQRGQTVPPSSGLVASVSSSLASGSSGSSPLASTNDYSCPSAPLKSANTTISLKGSTPFGIALDYANKNIYVADKTPDVIEEFNPATNTLLGNSTPIGTRLAGLTYDTARHELFVVSQGNGGTTPPVVYSLTRAQGIALPTNSIPQEIAYDKFNDQLYVTDYGSGQVSVLNPNTLKDVKDVTVQTRPWGLSVDPYNGFVFVADYSSNAISVISGTSVVASISANGSEPQGLVFDPINQMLYVSLVGSNGITIINATGNNAANYKVVNTFVKYFGTGTPGAMAFDCTHNVVWVADTTLNRIYGLAQCPGTVGIYDQFNFITAVPVGLQPQEFAYDNYTHGIYVTNYFSNSVTTYNTDTLKPALARGACPQGVADFGVNGGQTYTYTTTRFESITTFKSLTIGDSNIPKYSQEATDQLNVMTYGIATSIPNGVFWTQDVLSFNQNATCTVGTCFQLTSEIFNETKPGSAVNYVGAFAYKCNNHGVHGHVTKALETYYCDTKWEQGLTFPLTVKLLVETGTETSGKFNLQPFISFKYWLSSGPFPNQWIEYDRLHFNNALSGSRIPGNPLFRVSGNSAVTPFFSGTTRCGPGADGKKACPLMNDAENVIGGFAGGAAVVFKHVSATFKLEYWTGTAYTFIPHAFSAGADTGETAINVFIKGSATHFDGTSILGADDAVQLY